METEIIDKLFPKHEKEVEIINKLYLELSQFSTAKTERELILEKEVIRLSNIVNQFDDVRSVDIMIMNKNRKEIDELTSKLSDTLQRLPEEGK
jgi:hypothetical protein